MEGLHQLVMKAFSNAYYILSILWVKASHCNAAVQMKMRNLFCKGLFCSKGTAASYENLV